ncbi:hypothetical protein KVR01_011201 [Diaporthe batatas]|uniref:uncharacterized protein n=1 Tax=Diaporthe batatas TaxID=748121 RepID=UPI001D04D250|nr:uncharacterized protein KVR01_011201 [Diaporthe batatas]KAG8158758.1 hypothetical protein KVR01_011201 [Diaporthe batatas]
MSLGQLTSSELFACEPTAAPSPPVADTFATTVTETFTKVWLYSAWAACPTSEWPATYTIEEICTGDPATWAQPAVPPNFIKTVITCGVCVEKTQTITCPVEEAARTGDIRVYGNGVTATPAAVPARQTGLGSGPGVNSSPGENGAGSGPGSGAPAPGAGAGSASHPGVGAGGGSPAVIPVPVPHNNNGNAGARPPSPAPAGGEAAGSSPTTVMHQSNAGTDAASSPRVTASASSRKSSVLLLSGLSALASGLTLYY